MGAIALMLASDENQEIEHLLDVVEWDVLLFFAALFVMVEGMAELGLIRLIGDSLQNLVSLADPDDQLKVAIVCLIWISAIVSSFLDNIPYTATMVNVHNTHMPVTLWCLCPAPRGFCCIAVFDLRVSIVVT